MMMIPTAGARRAGVSCRLQCRHRCAREAWRWSASGRCWCAIALFLHHPGKSDAGVKVRTRRGELNGGAMHLARAADRDIRRGCSGACRRRTRSGCTTMPRRGSTNDGVVFEHGDPREGWRMIVPSEETPTGACVQRSGNSAGLLRVWAVN